MFQYKNPLYVNSDICGMLLTKMTCTSDNCWPATSTATSGSGKFVTLHEPLEIASLAILRISHTGKMPVTRFVVSLMPRMYGIDFKSPTAATMEPSRPRGVSWSTGSLRTGVKIRLCMETPGSRWSTGLGKPTSMKALHSVSPPQIRLGSFRSSTPYRRRAPERAAMMASLKVQLCEARTALMAWTGTGGIRVNTCRPLYFKNGFLCAFGGLNLSSASSFIAKMDKTPRKNILTTLHKPGKPNVFFLRVGACACTGLGAGAVARLPRSMAGSRILDNTSPSSHFISGRKANKSPKPSLSAW
mmetsp:Transcript_8338/g.24752  ORF Transcript_8338/g.24752 Transcript_8338/m.24752 type:complete len:301 (-) Transcript_8338:402-1304(-)